MREALDAGAVFNEGSGPIASANLNIVQISEAGGGGNRAEYLARRIARDRPDMLPAMAAGEYKSIHDAVRAEMVRVIARQVHALQEVRPVTAQAADGVRLRSPKLAVQADIISLKIGAPPVASVRCQSCLPDRVPDRPLIQARGNLPALCYPFAIRALCSPAATFS